MSSSTVISHFAVINAATLTTVIGYKNAPGEGFGWGFSRTSA